MDELGPVHLGTCRMTVALCEHLLEFGESSKAVPLLQCVLRTYERRFSELNAFVFEAKILLATGLCDDKKLTLGRGLLHELWSAADGNRLQNYYRERIEDELEMLPSEDN